MQWIGKVELIFEYVHGKRERRPHLYVRKLQRFINTTTCMKQVWFCTLLGLLFVACSAEPEHDDYVARLGDHYLMEEDIEEALESLPQGQNSEEAREQVIEQWIHNTLLYKEALRRGIQDDPHVQERLEDSERSLLVSTMMSTLEDEVDPPEQDELQSYFERHKERLRLREPYVHVRYLQAGSHDEAEAAREQLMSDYAEEVADSTWPLIIEEFSSDRQLSAHFDDTYMPERSVGEQLVLFRNHLGSMNEGEISPIEEHDGSYHFLQLVNREDPGTEPHFSWVEDEVRRMMQMESRKQTLARKVQELRNEATAREDLVVND